MKKDVCILNCVMGGRKSFPPLRTRSAEMRFVSPHKLPISGAMTWLAQATVSGVHEMADVR